MLADWRITHPPPKARKAPQAPRAPAAPGRVVSDTGPAPEWLSAFGGRHG